MKKSSKDVKYSSESWSILDQKICSVLSDRSQKQQFALFSINFSLPFSLYSLSVLTNWNIKQGKGWLILQKPTSNGINQCPYLQDKRKRGINKCPYLQDKINRGINECPYLKDKLNSGIIQYHTQKDKFCSDTTTHCLYSINQLTTASTNALTYKTKFAVASLPNLQEKNKQWYPWWY